MSIPGLFPTGTSEKGTSGGRDDSENCQKSSSFHAGKKNIKSWKLSQDDRKIWTEIYKCSTWNGLKNEKKYFFFFWFFKF